MNILVMGTGGVGGYFGALLSRSGHDVTVIARRGHLSSIQERGLRIDTVAEPEFTVQVKAVAEPPTDCEPDLILFAVKNYDVESAIDLIAPCVSETTIILSMLNGLDAADALLSRFGTQRVLDAVVYIESFVSKPGVITQAGGPRKIIFGKRSGNGVREERLLDLFIESGWVAELSSNILEASWTKLVFIGPFAAVNTLTGLRSNALSNDKACMNILAGMMEEYAMIANAEGAQLPANVVETSMERAAAFDGFTSMARDKIAGKAIEVDGLVKTIISRGKRHNIATPITSVVAGLMSPLGGGQSLE